MNRKQFFKRLGIGVAAVVVAPKIFEAKPEIVTPIIDVLPKVECKLSGKDLQIIYTRDFRESKGYKESMESLEHEINMEFIKAMHIGLERSILK